MQEKKQTKSNTSQKQADKTNEYIKKLEQELKRLNDYLGGKL